MKNNEIFEMLRQEGKLSKVTLYPATVNESDPYEHTTSTTFLNPITIQGLVTEIGFGGLKWKYWGDLTQGSVQLLCERKYESILKTAYKIKIGDFYYGVYQDADSTYKIQKREDYLIVILQKKVV